MYSKDLFSILNVIHLRQMCQMLFVDLRDSTGIRKHANQQMRRVSSAKSLGQSENISLGELPAVFLLEILAGVYLAWILASYYYGNLGG